MIVKSKRRFRKEAGRGSGGRGPMEIECRQTAVPKVGEVPP